MEKKYLIYNYGKKCKFLSHFSHTFHFFCCIWQTCTKKKKTFKQKNYPYSKLLILWPVLDFDLKLPTILEYWMEPPYSLWKTYIFNIFLIQHKILQKTRCVFKGPFENSPYLLTHTDIVLRIIYFDDSSGEINQI